MPDIFAVEHEERVPLSQELVRVQRLRRRVWASDDAEELAREMTAILKTEHGTMSLRPVQATALYEIGTVGGLLGVMRVGSGKTLVSMLAPVVLRAKRPLLIVPAALLDKTERDRRELALHWELPKFLRLMSYEWLGRAQAAEALAEYAPDVVIQDECHRARNLSAAVTRRIRRLFSDRPEVKCVAMSGTVTKRSLHDYAHILKWCLPPEQLPIPTNYSELELWAGALDERKRQTEENRAHPGALEVLCHTNELREEWRRDCRRAARQAFRRRLVETAGVIATDESPIDASLTIQSVTPDVASDVDDAFAKLRSDWETPDGWPISDGLAMFRHARELAIGFYYVWRPRPPREWLDARRVWCAFVREVLKHSRKLDSELQVRRAHAESEELRAWLAVASSFEPNTEAVWLDDRVLSFAAEWAEKNRGIVWTEHQSVGERLEQDFGLTYYGKKGRNSRGEPIENHSVDLPLVASIQSNSEGRNLQAWCSCLVVSCPPNGKTWEQMVGRVHRDGQLADEVSFEVVMTCAEHAEAFQQARRDAEYVQAVTGSPQKLLLAGTNVLRAEDIVSRKGPRWQK